MFKTKEEKCFITCCCYGWCANHAVGSEALIDLLKKNELCFTVAELNPKMNI